MLGQWRPGACSFRGRPQGRSEADEKQVDPRTSAPNWHRVTTRHISKAKARHLSQFVTNGAEKPMPPSPSLQELQSHAKGCGCVILTQGGSKESEQQRQYHLSSHGDTSSPTSAGYPGSPGMHSEAGH